MTSNSIAKKIAALQARKGVSPLAEITAYDYPTARLADEAGFDLLLVGDSLGMVVMGYPDTTHVRLEHMLHHVAMVARGAQQALIIGDLPIHSYDTPEQALCSAQALIAAGAHLVKLEGGADRVEQVRAITEAGIPVQGHIGLLPQRVKETGGYRIHGKNEQEALLIHRDMEALVQAGVCSLVIECTQRDLAGRITQACPVPTIGIGSGHGTCDGEVIVYHDLVGAFPWFTPQFVQPRAQIALDIQRAFQEWRMSLQVPTSQVNSRLE